MNRLVLTPRMIRVAAWAGAIALALGAFLLITHETVTKKHGLGLDRAVLLWFAQRRTPRLTAMMVDLTALGSSTLVGVFTFVAFVLLIAVRDPRGAFHLAVAALGTSVWTSATKRVIEKARPTEVEPLIEVTGFSYPSGHSLAAAALYLTMAIVAGTHLPSVTSRAVTVGAAGLLIGLVAVSRVYLGVHYPSDTAAGISLGVAWALMLAAVVAAIAAPRTRG